MDVVLGMIWDYVTLCHNSVSQYILIWTIFEIAIADERHPGSPEMIRLWKQEDIRFRNDGKGEDKL